MKNFKIGSIAIIFLFLISFSYALFIDSDIPIKPSDSNSTYYLSEVNDNISFNATHLGIDGRHTNIEAGEAINITVTDISENVGFSGDTFLSVTFDIIGVADISKSLTYLASWVYDIGTSVDGTAFTGNSFTATGLSSLFRIQEMESFTFNFVDELTGSDVDNVTLEVISDEISFTYNTTDSNITATIPAVPGIYTLRYNSDNYAERFYTFNIDDQTSQNITLYLLNDSSVTTISTQVVDNNGDPVEDALVKVLKYDVTSNTYNIIDSSQTNYDGFMLFSGVLNTEYYKFIVEFPVGTTKLVTSPTYLYSTSVLLTISTAEEVLTNYFSLQSIVSTLTFNTGTNNFNLLFNDEADFLEETCLKLYGIQGTSEELLNESCSSSSSGTILLPVYNGTNGYYSFRADSYFNDYYGESEYAHFQPDFQDDPVYLLYLVLLTIPVFFVFLFSPAIAVSLLPAPALMFSIIGFIPIPFYLMLPIQLVFIVLGVFIGNRG